MTALLLWVSSLVLSVSLSHKVAPTYHSVRSGWISDNSEYNWPVGVHKEMNVKGEYEHICGGSLISATLILSAAHCFWNNGEYVDLDKYRVTVGNFYRPYDIATPDSRKRIKKRVFHERYRGSELNYAHDIVIVQIEGRVTFDKRVGPISIDWNYSFRDKQLVGRSGTVLGWGFTETGKPSFSRIAAQLPYIPFGKCWDEVPPKFHSSITPDKFCAGLRNGTTVCPGDSGSGLAFYNSTAKKWYLRGIVSVGVLNPRTKGCGTNDFSVFTSIRFYLSWLLEMIPQLEEDNNNNNNNNKNKNNNNDSNNNNNNNNNNIESNFEEDRSHNSVYY